MGLSHTWSYPVCVDDDNSSSILHTECLDLVQDATGASGSYLFFGGDLVSTFFLVNHNPWRGCVICPLIVSNYLGSYFDAL